MPASRNALLQHPILFYSLITFGFSWVYGAVAFGILRIPFSFLTALPYILGPTVGAFVMTAATEARTGIRRLLGRLAIWLVHVFWYLFVLIGIPGIYLLGALSLPGAIASFHPLPVITWLAYPVNFVIIFLVGAPLFEEPGWRGFALPHLERQMGPFAGTLLLGVLWSIWHLPMYLVPAWANENGGLNPVSIAVFGLSAIAFGIIITWVFNHTRGSLLLVMLLHASVNTFQGYINRLFPPQANSEVNGLIGFGVAALVTVILTRGRLGYPLDPRDWQRMAPKA